VSTEVLGANRGFYVTGGTLGQNAPCYMLRQADADLYDGLKRGEFCYVLTSRQIGKSSLMVRTAARLREDGAAVVLLDLTAIGQNLTAEQWYGGLLESFAEQLGLEPELAQYWQEHQERGPLQRWMNALRDIVLTHSAGQVAVFVDEIDASRSLPFSTDEFFAGIRELYNRRTEDAELRRLAFCLLGVASPSELIRDPRTTPFNIGFRIELQDFSEAEAAPLGRGLGRDAATNAALLKRILYWTGGHPYLTQRLCQAITETPFVQDPAAVDTLCASLFFSSRAQESDDNLVFVRERILRSGSDLSELLLLHAQILKRRPVRDDDGNALLGTLKLSGLIQATGGRLHVRNRIYERVFDRKWVRSNMPDAEVRRQEAAYWRGALRAGVVAAMILLVIATLAYTALKEYKRAEFHKQLAYETLTQKTRSADDARQALQRLSQANTQTGEAERLRAAAEQQRDLANEEAHRAAVAVLALEKERKSTETQHTEAAAQKGGADQRLTEIEDYLWQSARKDPHDPLLQAYLALFPSGKYVYAALRAKYPAPESPAPASASRQAAPKEWNSVSGAISGWVVEASSRAPIKDVRIIAINKSTGSAKGGSTVADGSFVVGMLSSGAYQLIANHPDYEIGTHGPVSVAIGKLTKLKAPTLLLNSRSR